MNNEVMSVKDKMDEAISAAYTALYAKLTELGVQFDDCDTATYVDDKENRITYFITEMKVEKCDEYGGED